MKIVLLDAQDDIVSITDRLRWAMISAELQTVLFVLPEDGGVLREGLDIVRLRRHADDLRIDIGLVTADVKITRLARAVGIPVFLSTEIAARSRRGWWRGRKRRELVGLPTVGGDRLRFKTEMQQMEQADRVEVQRRLSPPASARQWLLRYGAILSFFLTLAILYVAFVTAVPGATITFFPETEQISAAQTIIADPALELVDYSTKRTPGRILTEIQIWQAEVNTSGVIQVPDAPARGVVLFVNQLEQPVTVPAGTRVSTSDGRTIRFQTVESITLPDTIGSTAEVEVIAVEPGPQGNIAANLVNRVEGALANQVEVRNLDPLEGGGFRDTAAVAEADRARLRAQVVQFLEAATYSELTAQISEREFLSRDSLRIIRILNETYSHETGEATARLALEMQVEIAGTAVNTTEASGLAYEALAAEVPDGYALVGDSIEFASGAVTAVDEDGRVTFSMLANGQVAANLALMAPLEAIAGQEMSTAVAYLGQSLPLRAPPQIAVWPIWFNRVPYLPARIQTEIVP